MPMDESELYLAAKQAALELLELDPEERERRLKELKKASPELAIEVTSWLSHLDTDTDHLAPRLDVPAEELGGLLSEAGLAQQSELRPTREFAQDELFAGRYVMKRQLGSGGMGAVWAALDTTLDETVALKFLRTPQGSSRADEWRTRLRDEVLAARQISHPGVCRVHDLGGIEGELFLSMQFVDGPNLAERIRLEGALPREATWRLARELSSALASIHDRGLLHRDLKPANVLFDKNGDSLISDFGLAVALDAEALRGTEARSGTRIYMAPEVLDGAPPSVASDLFALGLILFEAVTGRRAFRTPSAILEAARRGRGPVAPSTLRDDVDPVLERLILRCLSVRKHDRPKSAGEVARILEMSDPLDAVLALGEQPSPEVISSSRTRGLLTTKGGILVALVTWGLLFLSTLKTPDATPGRLPAESPLTIAHEARSRLGDALGLDPSPPYEYARFVDLRDLTTDDAFSSVPPSSRGFGVALRDSPRPLAPAGIGTLLTSGGQVQLDDPPLSSSHGHIMLCDLSGRPVLYRDATPMALIAGELSEERLTILAKALGLGKPADLRSVPPSPSRLGGSNLIHATRSAWAADPAGPRLELASSGDHIVAFDLLWPGAPQQAESSSDLLEVIVLLLLLLIGLPLSLRNLRTGRGDPFGAFRIALLIFVSVCVGWGLGASWPHDLGGALVYSAFATLLGLGAAALTWVFCMAAEPLIQREWPRCLITWNRALRGRLRDPVVASHILIGTAVAALELAFDYPVAEGLNLGGDSSLTYGPAVTRWLGGLSTLPFFALVDPLQLITGLALMGWLLRNRWLGVIPVLVLATLVAGAESRPELILSAAAVAIDLLLVLRYGLLALVANYAVHALFTRIPLTFHPSPWIETAALSAMGCLVLVQVLGILVLTRTYASPAKTK